VLLVSFILFNVYDLGPPWPSTNTDIAGSFTSSIKYNNLNEGKAININIIAGVMVQINSINVVSILMDYVILLNNSFHV